MCIKIPSYEEVCRRFPINSLVDNSNLFTEQRLRLPVRVKGKPFKGVQYPNDWFVLVENEGIRLVWRAEHGFANSSEVASCMPTPKTFNKKILLL